MPSMPSALQTFAILSLALTTSACAGCHSSHAAQAPEAPPGDVWLTATEVVAEKIVVAPAVLHDIDMTLTTGSRVTFDDLRVSHVYSPLTGQVERIDAKPGQHVKKGDRLAVLSSPELGSAAADERKARADLSFALRDNERKKELALHDAVSATDTEQAEDNFRKARAELERSQQKLSLLRGGGYDAVSQTFSLVAPIDGEVISRAISPGVQVQGLYSGGTAVELFTIGQLDEVWVVADLYEPDVPRVAVGARAKVTIGTPPAATFDTQVDWVSQILDPVTRTAKVRCSIKNPDRLLKPDMYATTEIAVSGHPALAIPRSAVVGLGDQKVVFIEVGNTPDGARRFERVPVLLDDAPGSDWVPVLHGLEPGTIVVTSGADALSAKL